MKESLIFIDEDSSAAPVRVSPIDHKIDPARISENAWRVLKGLNKAGFEAFLVGGAVRDLLLDRHPKDFDIATDATPEEVRKVFRNARLIGRRFMIVHVRYGREIIEVATFRASHADAENSSQARSDGLRLIRDNVYGELDTDVWRRDFTANALYYDGRDESIVDYVNGIADINDRILRIIGDPETRFEEDPVRMLRALRFAGKLDFKIDQAYEPLLTSQASLLKDGSPARLFDEVIKLFHGGAAQKTFDLLRQYNMFRYFFPGAEQQFVRENDGQFLALVNAALESTDKRVAQGKPVTPAFLVAVMLWNDVRYFAEQGIGKKVPPMQSWLNAGQRVVSKQSSSLSIPRRFSLFAKEMWVLQTKFSARRGKRALSVLVHARFRAAYDFLCLRYEAGEQELADDVTFWTDIQELSEQEQLKLLQLKDRRHIDRPNGGGQDKNGNKKKTGKSRAQGRRRKRSRRKKS